MKPASSVAQHTSQFDLLAAFSRPDMSNSRRRRGGQQAKGKRPPSHSSSRPAHNHNDQEHGNILEPDHEENKRAGSAQVSGVLLAQHAPDASPQIYLIDRSFDFLKYLIEKATESKETQQLLLRAGRHFRRSVRLVLVFLVFCALVFGIGIGVAVSVAGLKPLAALLVGLTGSATFGLIGGLAVRTWCVRAKRFFLELAHRQDGDPPNQR
jgi:hypothetical protein